MTNEEFQKVVLQELKGLREGQEQLNVKHTNLEEGMQQLNAKHTNLEEGMQQLNIKHTNLEEGMQQLNVNHTNLEERLQRLEVGQEDIKRDLKAVIEQTAELTEFRQEANEKLDSIIEDSKSIHGILGEHEVSIRTIRRNII